MKKINEWKCDCCGNEVRRFKYLKKLNGGFFCKKCVSKRRKKHREYLEREICGIRTKKQQIRDWKEKNKKTKKQNILRRIVSNLPKIKSIRNEKQKISALGLYLTRNEKLILYRKLINKGYDSEKANKRINNITKQLEILVKKLRQTKKIPKELQIKFQEGFARLCEETE